MSAPPEESDLSQVVRCDVHEGRAGSWPTSSAAASAPPRPEVQVGRGPDQIDIHDAALVAARERAWAILRDVVAEAQRAGWRTDQPTYGIAMTCWVLVHGSAALWREGWLAAQFPDAAVRQLVRGMLASVV